MKTNNHSTIFCHCHELITFARLHFNINTILMCANSILIGNICPFSPENVMDEDESK